MNPIKVEMTLDEATARAIPALRPLLGKRVELIALQMEGEAAQAPRRRTPDELLAARLTPPPGVAPMTLDSMGKPSRKGRLVRAIDPGRATGNGS